MARIPLSVSGRYYNIMRAGPDGWFHSLLKRLFAFNYVCVCVCVCPCRLEEGIVCPGAEVMDSCEPPYGFWESNPGPLEGQPEL